MNKILKWVFGGIICTQLHAQQLKKIELQAEGKVEWQFLLPLAEKGAILVYKNEITKATAIRFDAELNEVWKSEFFLDVENQPRAYTIEADQISLMFSENNGAYYQVYSVKLDSGKIDNFGFEIKEYFQDQDYILLDKGVLMAGANEKGTSFYKYTDIDAEGEQIPSKIQGISRVQYMIKIPNSTDILGVFNIQKTAENSKKKSEPIVISSEILVAKINFNGEILEIKTIKPQNGNNPLTAKCQLLPDGSVVLSGTYRNPSGQTGVYIAKTNFQNLDYLKFYPFDKLLSANKTLTPDQYKALLTNFQYMQHDLVVNNDQTIVAGEFFKPEFRTYSERNNNYYNNPYGTGYGNYGNFGLYDPYGMNQRTTTKQVFMGYRFTNGYVYTFDNEGNMTDVNAIPVEKLTGTVSESFAFDANKSVALVQKGTLKVNSLTDPGINQTYQLSSTNLTKELQNAQYTTIKHWYGNFFLGLGYKNETTFEKIATEELPKKKKMNFGKKNNVLQVNDIKYKRVIYLTKIAS